MTRNHSLSRFARKVLVGFVLGGVCLVLPPAGQAQLTNGSTTVVQGTLSSGGGRAGHGSSTTVVALIGQPVGGVSASGMFKVVSPGGTAVPVDSSVSSLLVTVTGSVDDPTASVNLSVNGAAPVAVSLNGLQFSVANVQLFFGPNKIRATATDPAGNVSTAEITVYVDLSSERKQPNFAVDVVGSIDDPTATVDVNGIPASVAGGQFTARAVPLTQGYNPLTATATDPAGNRTKKTIGVFVDTSPPARPTTATPPPATTATLTGTKTPGTSIWVNGVQVVPLNGATSWSASVNLIEGDNLLVIVAKDAAGNTSTADTRNIILDNLAPVLTINAPAKTNLGSLTITGTVDDSLTVVTTNGAAASRSQRTFSVAVPLVEGPNAVTFRAVSPNGYVTTQTRTITLGTIPTVTSIRPTDGTKSYIGQSLSIAATATDKENDPLQYQILIDGVVVVDWFTGASYPWTPSQANLGIHTLEVRVRDGFGGYGSGQSGVFVLRQPVPPSS